MLRCAILCGFVWLHRAPHDFVQMLFPGGTIFPNPTTLDTHFLSCPSTQAINERFTFAKPQIAEDFAWYLMEVGESQEDGKTLTLTHEQLNMALASLATTIMARERTNYENYSMFYENLLRQHHQLLYQREQVHSWLVLKP